MKTCTEDGNEIDEGNVVMADTRGREYDHGRYREGNIIFLV